MRFSLVHLVRLFSLLHGAQSQSFFVSDGNSILSNGTYYTADPALIVLDRILLQKTTTTSPFKTGDLLASKDPNPAGGEWALYSDFVSPHSVFRWADPGAAYASQIVRGPDGGFYLSAPVAVADTKNSDPFGIGVARADRIEGPYVDHHPEGPIVSQS
ncbi:hypothetical protein E4U54_007469 [Claviceps lovelessii]|nr:hypothetical protein E4U54_007469 [Claviceps lovelessii]